jgi:pyruvate dehydrogenase E2 component (dihydrolipoamide acetyltransferase)
MKTIQMPSFGSDMEHGTLTEWFIKSGDRVAKGDVIAVIETHKGAIELDIFDTGVIDSLLLEAGEAAPVGTPIARLRLDKETLSDTQPIELKQPLAPPPQTQIDSDGHSKQTATEPQNSPLKAQTPVTDNHSRILASPAARQLAGKLGLELNQQHGTGPGGAICLRDIGSPPATPSSSSPSGSVAPSTSKPAATPSLFDPQSMRKAIAETVTRSKREIPHYYLERILDISRLQTYLRQVNAQSAIEDRAILAAPLLCAIARLLKRYPELNGHFDGGHFQSAEHVHLANALHLRGAGLVMPVIQDASELEVPHMMKQLNQLVENAQTGQLKYSQISGASCSVTSIGERGCDAIWGVIYPPQVAIVGLGRPRQGVAVENDQFEIKELMTATLSADHRISDGHLGARFLHELNQSLQKPEQLWTTA